jgi:hypothetical protein
MMFQAQAETWSWLLDQLAAELAAEPRRSRSEILRQLDRAAGYPLVAGDAELLPVNARRRELVDRLLARLDGAGRAEPVAPKLALSEYFAKSVTLA